MLPLVVALSNSSLVIIKTHILHGHHCGLHKLLFAISSTFRTFFDSCFCQEGPYVLTDITTLIPVTGGVLVNNLLIVRTMVT